jgi:hypothetical protein
MIDLLVAALASLPTAGQVIVALVLIVCGAYLEARALVWLYVWLGWW